MLIRARLAQAFGRLIRRQGDKGQFVLLSSAVPSRFISAFPPSTPIKRVTLEEAVTRVQAAQRPAASIASAINQRFPEAQNSGKGNLLDDDLPSHFYGE